MPPIATRWLRRFELERELARIRYRLMICRGPIRDRAARLLRPGFGGGMARNSPARAVVRIRKPEALCCSRHARREETPAGQAMHQLVNLQSESTLHRRTVKSSAGP
jgi:hypothetical protein